MVALAKVLAACAIAAPVIALAEDAAGAGASSQKEGDCDQLAAGGLKFHGWNVSLALAVVCDVWPARFGKFPVDDASMAEALVNATFGKGGVAEKVGDLVRSRKENTTFCWKQDVYRELREPTGYTCPRYLNKGWVHERVTDMSPTRGPSGNMTCEKSCADVCFDEFQLMAELPNHQCKCRSKEPMLVGTSGFIYVWRTVNSVALAEPEGCSFTNDKEQCFGECPAAFEGAFIEGSFSPLCATTCSGTANPDECGFGCAQSIGKCMWSLTDQISEIVRVVGDTASFFMAGPEAAATFDSLVSTVEFTMAILGDLVDTFVRAVFDAERRREKLGLILALVMFAADFGGALAKDRSQLAAEVSKSVSLLGDLADAKWSWFDMRWDVPSARDILLQHGRGVVMEFYNLFAAFFWPRCKPAPATLIV